jgi:hypothetical protein
LDQKRRGGRDRAEVEIEIVVEDSEWTGYEEEEERKKKRE